jgi:carboxyl-terminal processing protease
VRAFAEAFPAAHLSRLPLDETIARRAWTNYLTSLDYERVFFTQADIDRFRVEEALLADQLKSGDLHFASSVFEVYLQRLSNRCDYVDSLLKQGFDVNVQESYTWKRRDMPWPADEKEWDDLWRRRIKNEYVQRLVVKAMAAAATNPPAGGDAGKENEEFRKRDAALTPEEFIRKRHQQLRTVLTDSDSEWILQRFLTAFAQAYDPHSGYMSPSAAEDFDIEMKLSLVGIGALLRSEDGAAQIERIIPGGPADRDKREKRLRPGDRIVAVAQDKGEPVDVLHWPLYKVVKLIRGPKGTRVFLTVLPASDPSGVTTKIVDMIRDEVKLEEQAARGRLESVKGSNGVARSLAVITLPAFYANMKATSTRASDYRSASDDVRKLLDDLRNRGAQGVLLDLRNNGGGSLIEAIRMTGLFIRTGPVVQVREGYNIRILRDNDPDIAYAGPVAVLVDRRSASASEIVAGALQDYGRAIVLGDSKTHGKGTVQSVVDVGRDPLLGSIKVTTASYFRISGGSTQLRGIAADIVVPSPFDCMEVGEEFLPNAMAWSRVPPAPFLAAGDPARVVPELREKSLARRRGDERFGAYDKLLQRVQELSRTRELSLNLAERKHTAAMEKDLSDLEDRLNPDVGGAEENKDKVDLILEEGLKVLADWTTIQEQRPAAPPPAEEPGLRTLSETVSEWIRKVF